MLYEIANWSKRYENAGSRKIVGALDWFACPTKHDGLSYRRLMKRPDGMELYGAWALILAVAAKCEVRGRLESDGRPMTAEDIALKTGGCEKSFSKALQVFSSKDFAWLTGSTPADADTTLPASPDEVALQDITGQDTTGQNKTEPDRTQPPAAPSPSKPPAIDRSEDVRRVFEHYRARFPKKFPKVHSGLPEWRKILDRFRDGYSVDDLCDAIDGCMRSPWHQGQNDRRKPFNHLELIVRDAKHVDDFRAIPARAGPVLNQKNFMTLTAIESAVAREFPDDESEAAYAENSDEG